MAQPSAQHLVSVAPIVQVDRVSRVIRNGDETVVLLDDVSFDVAPQSLFVINGPSGSGKSTLLNMLPGIDRPTSGRIVLAGREVVGGSENELARWRGRTVGIVFQFFQLIPTLTAAENVMLALQLGGGGGTPRRQWRRRSLDCLEHAGAPELADRLPSQLSGGQQQRVAIARALANDPPVIVADEPTGNLDSRSATAVFDVLASLRERGKTVVYVTHDPGLATRADDGIELLDGRVVGRVRAAR